MIGILFAAFLGIHFISPQGWAVEEDLLPRHVLLLHSYSSDTTWVKNIEKGVFEELHPDTDNLIVHIEYMDSKRHHDGPYYKLLERSMAYKYKDFHLSLILCSDNNAFDFLMQRRQTLFPGVPISFCGVNDFKPEMLQGDANITGVAEIISPVTTVELMVRLHPGVKHIYVINDYLTTGRAWRRDMEARLGARFPNLDIEYNDNLSMGELQKKIRGFGQDTAILLGDFFADRLGNYLTYEGVGTQLTSISPVPVYCLLDFNLRDGVVGGNVINGYSQGQEMARLGKQILSGVPVSTLPVLHTGVNTWRFDYTELQRFKVSMDELPRNAVVLNRPFSFYDNYKVIIWVTMGAFVCLLIILIMLVINIHSRKRTEKVLQEQEAELRHHRDRLKELVEERTAQLARVNTDLAMKNDELEQIVYVASHDLRSPLVNIDGYSRELNYSMTELRQELEKILGHDLPPAVAFMLEEDMQEALRFIRTSAVKMDKLLMGLLHLSRSGRGVLSMENIDMNAMVSQVVDAIEYQIKESHVEVIINDLPPCRGDGVQINQVFSNIIGNALKYLDPEKKGLIEISGTVEDSQVTYCVADNGIGMDPRFVHKIFEIFHRLDPAHSQGDGLGLSIVKRIMDRLKGKVRVESQLGEGSRFYLSFSPATAKLSGVTQSLGETDCS